MPWLCYSKKIKIDKDVHKKRKIKREREGGGE